MGLDQSLNSLQEFHLSFCSEHLDKTHHLIYISVLWLLLLFFYFVVGIPSTPTCLECEYTQKHQGRARRRKGGTLKGSRYYQKEEQKRRPNSILKSPLSQHHDTTRFHQRLCSDLSCGVYNNTTTELSQLPVSEPLEDSLPSVSHLASTAPVTEPLSTQSSALSTVLPGDLIPPTMPEPFPPPPSVPSSNTRTSLGNFLSPSPPGQTLTPKLLPPLESESPVHHSLSQPKDSFSSNLAQCDSYQEFPALHSTKTSSGGDAASKLIDPGHPLFLSPDEHDSALQYSFPKTRKDHLKQKLIQLFWGLPSLHSESLSSSVHVLGDHSSIFIFNSISNASTGQEPPVLPYFLPPSLLEAKPQSLPPTLSQSQPLPLTQIQTQAHLQSPLPILTSGPSPRNSVYGVQFHEPQNELNCLTSPEMQHLEWNVLQKKQESLWGLPTVARKSREDFCPSAPTSPYRWLSKAYVPISIDSVEFPLSGEIREKLEHHLKKRLIQHRWGLPRRIQESLTLMKPPNYCRDKCESKSTYGLSWISTYKSQSSQPESFHDRGSEMVQAKEDKGMDEKQSQENDPKDQLSDSEGMSDKDVGNDSEKEQDMMNLSEENSVVLEQSESQGQLEKDLKVHLSKEFEEISEGQLPDSMHGSWHAIEQTSAKPHTPSVKPHTAITQEGLPPSVGGNYYLNTSQDLPFLDFSVKQALEVHITKFRIRGLWGLPVKVLESIKLFKLKSHSNPDSSSTINPISELKFKSGRFKPLRGSSQSLHGKKLGKENSASILNTRLPATSLVSQEEQGPLRSSPSDIKHKLVKELGRISEAKQTLLPVTNNITDKANQKHSLIDNIHPPKLPSRQTGARQEPKDERVNSSDIAEMQMSKNTEEKAEPASMPHGSREIVKAKELSTVQNKTAWIANNPGIFQRINMNKTQETSTMTTKMPAPKTLVAQDPESADFSKQVIDELKSKLAKRMNGQAEHQPTVASSETHKASLPGAQGVSRVDMGSQVLHVHVEDTTVSSRQWQEPWVPKKFLGLCPTKNFPPAAKNMSPTGSKPKELGGGDAGMVTPQPGTKRIPTQGSVLQQMVGSKSLQRVAQRRQPPPDSLFINKMKNFFQWLQPGIRDKRQENPQVKGSPVSPMQSRGPDGRTATRTGMTEAQFIKSNVMVGKFPSRETGASASSTYQLPSEPLPWAAKLGTALQKAAVQAQGEPAQGHPLNSGAPSCKSCHQAAVFASQSPRH